MRICPSPLATAPALALVICSFFGIGAQAEEATKLQWKCSTQAGCWEDKTAVPISSALPQPAIPAHRIVVNSTRPMQVIDGWGGCFNERGWKAMEVLSPIARAAVMNALFDPKTGLKLNFCRTPIGASDYGIDLYSLNETPNDYSMANFSIARDKERLIP